LLIDVDNFHRLRRNLKCIRDLNHSSYSRGALFTILSQKRVDMVKRDHPKAINKLDSVAKYWNGRKQIPNWLDMTPVMRLRILLKAIGFNKAEVRKSLNNPGKVNDEKLEHLIWNALFTDFVYSPLAVKHQFARGRLGEEIIKQWLEERDIEFKDEKEMRKESSKTPDFYFPRPIRLNGKEIHWIESKALFGDPKTHRVYSKKQFHKYKEMFGNGYVVYWYGFVKGLNNNVDFLSSRFFNSALMNPLMDMKFYTCGVNAFKNERTKRAIKRLSFKHLVDLDGNIPEVNSTSTEEIKELLRRENFYEYMRSKDFLQGMGNLIDLYSDGRVLLISKENDWRKCHRKNISWVLRNLGFEVIHMRST